MTPTSAASADDGSPCPPSPATANAATPGSGIADELAIRAGLDPAWDAVLAVYLEGADRYPQPFVNRRP